MDARAKYYRAINDRYDLLLRLHDLKNFESFIFEFHSELDGIIEVMVYDEDIRPRDFVKVKAYIKKLLKNL